MPNQRMTSGISARCGMLRIICSVVSVTSRLSRDRPLAMPRPRPIAPPTAKPGERAAGADPDVLGELARLQQPPAGGGHRGRRRQHAARDQARRAPRLPRPGAARPGAPSRSRRGRGAGGRGAGGRSRPAGWRWLSRPTWASGPHREARQRLGDRQPGVDRLRHRFGMRGDLGHAHQLADMAARQRPGDEERRRRGARGVDRVAVVGDVEPEAERVGAEQALRRPASAAPGSCGARRRATGRW